MGMMEELSRFLMLHGKPLTMGMKVRVASSNDYAADWPDEYYVIGVNWRPGGGTICAGRIDVTIADALEHDGGADGWSPSDLVPVI